MKLKLIRNERGPSCTIGELYIDGQFECFTLEDVVRGCKLPGLTAIPSGEYTLVIDLSSRFGRLMPHLLEVPGFSGIRIHSGNTDKDTEGCILVGRERCVDHVEQSHLAFTHLFDKLEHSSAPITIQIVNDF